MNDQTDMPDDDRQDIVPAGMDLPPRRTRQEMMTFDDAGAAAVERNELRQAMEIAREYPRSIEVWQARSRALVLSSVDAADEAIYALPPRKNDKGVDKVIEGPSIRFAEAISYAWGNYRVATRIAHEGEEFITCTGVFFDLETNALVSADVPRSIKGKYGRYKPDMIRLTAAAGMSIALRNAVLRAIPKALWWPIYLSARAMVAGDFKHLSQRVEMALRQLQKMGADEPKVLAALNVTKVAEITPEHIVILRGMATAIRDGESTVADLFPDDTPVMFGVPRVDIGQKLREGRANGEGDKKAAGGGTVAAGGSTEAKPRSRKKAAADHPEPPPTNSSDTGGAAAGTDALRHDKGHAPGAAVDAPAVAAVGEAVSDAAPKGSGAAVGDDGLDRDERILIDEFRAALDEADSDLELAAARSEFAGAMENARPEVRTRLAAIAAARREAVEAKKRAALSKL